MISFIFLILVTAFFCAAAYGQLYGKPEAMPVNKKTGERYKQNKAVGILWVAFAIIFGLLAINKILSGDLKPEPPKTPEQIAQQKRIDEARQLNGQRRDQLVRYLKNQARDPSSVEFRNEIVVPNGVCIEMNGKNAFGGYAGWSRFCGIIDKNGKMIVSEVE
jgi:hypothetical protein